MHLNASSKLQAAGFNDIWGCLGFSAPLVRQENMRIVLHSNLQLGNYPWTLQSIA